ncbi:MAG: Uma2 family endonuclease [Leptolyngbyaceae bacterium]|nr:Uma2 family endonuclease [Leptolyngbyaceae bacterium]
MLRTDGIKRDGDLKAPVYAQSSIIDYWILDIPNRQLLVFREPTATGYRRQFTLTVSDTAAPLAFPDCLISVASLVRSLSNSPF